MSPSTSRIHLETALMIANRLSKLSQNESPSTALLKRGSSSVSASGWTASCLNEWRFLQMLIREASQESQRVATVLLREITAWNVFRRTPLLLTTFTMSAAVLRTPWIDLHFKKSCSSRFKPCAAHPSVMMCGWASFTMTQAFRMFAALSVTSAEIRSGPIFSNCARISWAMNSPEKDLLHDEALL